MPPEVDDDLILRHLDGETTPEEQAQVTRLLAESPQLRSRFFSFVFQVAQLREILDNRFTDSPGEGTTPVEVGMATQPATMNPRLMPQASRPEPVRAGFFASLNIDFRRIYLNAVVGGMGGLLGWLVIKAADLLLSLNTLNVYVKDAVIGPLVGVCIGLAVGGTEGLLDARSVRRMLKGGRYGAALGAAGGVLGLVLGELIFNLAGGGVWSRALGWGFFGAFVGISEGVAHRMPAKIRYGILGGLIGGLIGGATFEGLVALARGKAGALDWGVALGLIILGACIGFLVSLVETLLRKSWVFFVTGRLEGQTRTLDSSRPHTIGSDPGCTIVVPGDPTVAPVHAEIVFLDGDFLVRPREGAVNVRHDDVDQAVTAHLLCPGDRIILGETRMIFRNVEGKKS